MNRRRVVSSRFPYLPVHVAVRSARHDVEALLDTGFDGDLALPPELVMNGDPPDGHHRWRLADGSIVRAPFYVGTLRVGATEMMGMLVTAMGDEPIVGRGILTEFTVILDHAQRLIIEP